jgi:ABC-2 type transport system ATP-binding protein
MDEAVVAEPRAGVTEASAVEVRGLRVVRGGNVVLPDLSVSVPRGSITGLLGPSGCGKSTLMRSIVGVQRVTDGEVTVLGVPAGSPELRRRVGYVTQAPSVYADLTVRENLRYFARVLGSGADSVAEVIATVGLEPEADRIVANISGGQSSRVSLAVALLVRPPLLVLDEPTVGLDPLLRRDLWGTFRRLVDDGATILVSSHVMDEAEECDLLLLMRDGRLVARETPDALRRRTGTDDLGEAFLRLIEREEVAR